MPISRKLLTRIIGAPLLLAVLGALLYWGYQFELEGKPNAILALFLEGVAILAFVELRAFGSAKNLSVDLFALPAVMAVLAGGIAIRGDPLALWGAVSLVTFLYFCVKIVFCYGRFTPEAAGFTFLVYGYLSLLLFLLIPPVPRSMATLYLLFLLAAAKGSDMAAFVVGKSMGRHKMTPVLSPNKTWEGAIGGAIVGTGAGLAVLLMTPLQGAYAAVPFPKLIFYALIVTMAAQMGDLVKSALKRWAGLKDSGRLLPEFGGMLDMVDSFLICAPVAHLATWSLR
jgi:CDP-diglyceride synthetase